ncbi:hypothetical protein ECMA6_2596, partial [Escherichia coli MA6]
LKPWEKIPMPRLSQ